MMRPLFVSLVLAAILAAATWLGLVVGTRSALLWLVAIGLGMTLLHASFGFTTAWRNLLLDGEGAGVRAQMLMLAVAALLFYPVLGGAWGPAEATGLVRPLGVSVVAGGFLFGVGMQLGHGCASGTLYKSGGLQLGSWLTLVCMIVGATVAARHYGWWIDQPALAPVSLLALSWPVALLVNGGLFLLIAGATLFRERQGTRGRAACWQVQAGPGRPAARWLRGPWPLCWGALALALLNFAVLWLAGHPWAISSAFALWGIQSAQAMGLGLEVAFWDFGAVFAERLALPWYRDTVGLMNVGLVAGAMLALALSTRVVSLRQALGGRAVAASVVGGLLMGYGATIAYGCNIGAFFGGIASGSLHGWLWLVAALPGNVAGLYLRPLFGMRGFRSRPAPG